MFLHIKISSVLLLTITIYTINLSLADEPEDYDNTEGVKKFWEGLPGQQFISKLNTEEELDRFAKHHHNGFLMLYATWCENSEKARPGFVATAAQMYKMTGKAHTHFGAFDCGPLKNKWICRNTFNTTIYPRFYHFENGQMDRQYPVKCPRHYRFFLNWILDHGNEKYCSGSEPVEVRHVQLDDE